MRRSVAGLLWPALVQVLTKQDHVRRATSASVHICGDLGRGARGLQARASLDATVCPLAEHLSPGI